MEVVTISKDDLVDLISTVVRKELDARERPTEIMTKTQLSEYTGWSLSTIRRKMKEGLPYFGGGDTHPRFLRRKVDEFLTQERSYL